LPLDTFSGLKIFKNAFAAETSLSVPKPAGELTTLLQTLYLHLECHCGAGTVENKRKSRKGIGKEGDGKTCGDP